MLLDKVRVDFLSGKGGDGFGDLTREYPVTDGGNGGDGGNVYLVGDENTYDLKNFTAKKDYVAEDGKDGTRNEHIGKSGEEIYIKVPLVTHVYRLDGIGVYSVEEHGQKVLLLKGGDGGLGSAYFKNNKIKEDPELYKGKRGRSLKVFLELHLHADILFIGFPNAGKSSMLNALCGTRAKVANYPFTTLEPQLGTLGKLTLMDLPGLIQGTFEGKGLGTKFTRHTKTATTIAHFISLESEDIEKDYLAMREELKNIDQELYDSKEILVLTKADTTDEDTITLKKQELEKYSKDILVCSISDPKSLESLKERFLEI